MATKMEHVDDALEVDNTCSSILPSSPPRRQQMTIAISQQSRRNSACSTTSSAPCGDSSESYLTKRCRMTNDEQSLESLTLLEIDAQLASLDSEESDIRCQLNQIEVKRRALLDQRFRLSQVAPVSNRRKCLKPTRHSYDNRNNLESQPIFAGALAGESPSPDSAVDLRWASASPSTTGGSSASSTPFLLDLAMPGKFTVQQTPAIDSKRRNLSNGNNQKQKGPPSAAAVAAARARLAPPPPQPLAVWSAAASDDNSLSSSSALQALGESASDMIAAAISDDDNCPADPDRPTTPDLSPYNPDLLDKRFRGKAVPYRMLRRFTDNDAYINWIRQQKVTRDKRTETESGTKDFFRCPYARKIGFQPCPFRMYALFNRTMPRTITVYRSEVGHYHAQAPVVPAANTSTEEFVETFQESCDASPAPQPPAAHQGNSSSSLLVFNSFDLA